jgi:hypothetical protein
MADLEPIWHALRADEPYEVLRFAIPFVLSATLGAALAMLVTWIEEHLTEAEGGKDNPNRAAETAGKRDRLASTVENGSEWSSI